MSLSDKFEFLTKSRQISSLRAMLAIIKSGTRVGIVQASAHVERQTENVGGETTTFLVSGQIEAELNVQRATAEHSNGWQLEWC